jgi:diguanylate cyclase (GGDEF)-like protein
MSRRRHAGYAKDSQRAALVVSVGAEPRCVSNELDEDSSAAAASAVLDELLLGDSIDVVVQPIVRLADSEIVAFEALSRMKHPNGRSPEPYLHMAAGLGRRDELELACLEAIAGLGDPPHDALLFVNVSPMLLSSPRAMELRDDLPRGLVLELTEQAEVDDYKALRTAVEIWKSQGARIAVDDLGSGWSSFRHVIQLQPDFIKIDRSLIMGVDHYRSKRALVCSMVAFAREAGCTVVAEGVERPEELQVLREAEVSLVQGYLLAHPAPRWPSAARPTRMPELSSSRDGSSRTRLKDYLASCTSAREACNAVAAHLFGFGSLMPSVYLQRGDVLRCVAQRGLWQVLDGMPPGVGITGQAFSKSASIFVPDVRQSPDYLEAIPGVISELCVPLFARGVTVGSLNVESYGALTDDAIAVVQSAAMQLGQRLEQLGTGDQESASQRLARHATHLADASTFDSLYRRLLAGSVDVTNMNSAALALIEPDGELRVVETMGPLGPVLRDMEHGDLDLLSAIVDHVASCYTAGDSTGAGFSGVDGLRSAGIRAMVVVPISKREKRVGLLLVADTTPMLLETDEAERVELLGAHAATCLENLRMLHELRDRAQRDPLTGLHNHSAFHEDLRTALAGDESCALLLADIDRFKGINDEYGHLLGDEVLQRCAGTLGDALRGSDQLFRIGGDEFAVIIPGVGPERAMALARRLVECAHEVLGQYGAALSVGATMLKAGDSRATVFERADRGLYRAKRERLGTHLAIDHPTDMATTAG